MHQECAVAVNAPDPFPVFIQRYANAIELLCPLDLTGRKRFYGFVYLKFASWISRRWWRPARNSLRFAFPPATRRGRRCSACGRLWGFLCCQIGSPASSAVQLLSFAAMIDRFESIPKACIRYMRSGFDTSV